MSIDKFTVLIPTYNNGKELYNCVKSINKISKHIQKIIIINNGHTKIKILKKTIKHTTIKVINNKKNLGFAKAVNKGIIQSTTSILLLLNPDTIILDKSPLKLFTEINKNKDIGIIGGSMVNDKKEKFYTANGYPNLLTAIFEFTNIKKLFPNNFISKNFWMEKGKQLKKTEVYGLCGAYIFFRKYLKNKTLNLFCTDYFMYMEDVDFCLTNIRHGYKVIFDPRSKIYHAGGSSSKNKYKTNIEAWHKSRKIFFLTSEHKIKNPILRWMIFVIYSIEEYALYFYHKLKHEPAY